MPDEFKQNFSQPDQSPQAQLAVPSIAPPPTEVSIRTMASDLASLGETGGGPPRPRNVAVPSLQQSTNEGANDVSASSSSSKVIVTGIVVVASAAGLFFAGYYFLFPFLASVKSPKPAAVLPVASSSIPLPAQPAFKHASFFRQPVDGTFVLKISSATEGIQAQSGQLSGFLAGLASSSTFFECAGNPRWRVPGRNRERPAGQDPELFGQEKRSRLWVVFQ